MCPIFSRRKRLASGSLTRDNGIFHLKLHTPVSQLSSTPSFEELIASTSESSRALVGGAATREWGRCINSSTSFYWVSRQVYYVLNAESSLLIFYMMLWLLGFLIIICLVRIVRDPYRRDSWSTSLAAHGCIRFIQAVAVIVCIWSCGNEHGAWSFISTSGVLRCLGSYRSTNDHHRKDNADQWCNLRNGQSHNLERQKQWLTMHATTSIPFDPVWRTSVYTKR